MKQAEEKKQEQKRTALLVRTMSNGYSVDLEREGYMFYTLQDLMEGLFVHVGMNRLGVMTKEEIKEMVKATKDGSIVKKLQAEVNELKDIIAEQKKEIREQKKEIRKLTIDN
jgi:DNA-binding transcriptional MerR regulator